MSKWTRPAFACLTFLLILSIAFGLRLRAVDKLPIDFDEDDYLRAGQEYATGFRTRDFAVLTDRNYRPEHPQLTKMLYGVALTPLYEAPEIPDVPPSAPPAEGLPQPHWILARLVSVVFGVLEVLVGVLLNPLAGFLLAIHTFTIKYTSQAMLESLPAFTSALAVYAYWRAFPNRNRGEGSGSRVRPGWLLLSSISLGLTAAGKYIYCVVGISILIHWAWANRTAQPEGAVRWFAARLKPIVLWGIGALTVFLLCSPYLWPDPLGRLAESVTYHAGYATSEYVQSLQLPFWQLLATTFQSVPWHPGVFLISLDALIGILAILGWRSLKREYPVFAVWLVSGLAFLLSWPTKWPQYLLIYTFPLSLAAGLGLKERILEPLTDWIDQLSARRRMSSTPRRSSWERMEARTALLWMLPGVLILLAITFYPLLYQAGIALTDFNTISIRDGINGGIWREVREGLSGQSDPMEVETFSFSPAFSREVHFVGLNPFKQILSGAVSDVLVFEVLWTLLVVSLQAGLGIVAALLLNNPGLRFRSSWITLFILPWAIPEFVGALIWMQIFNPKFGWFFLGTSWSETPGFVLAQELAAWESSPNAALIVLLISGVWMGFPLMMLAATAGLKMIPLELYEAAEMDGAGRGRKFASITWPLLLPLLTPALIIRGIMAFNQFYLFYVFNPPYPALSLASISYFFFDFGGNYAASAVINMFTVLILLVFVVWFNRVSRAAEGVTYV